MVYERELAGLYQYIKNFDPREFSSVPDFDGAPDEEFRRKSADKFKARIKRRRQMEQRLKEAKFLDKYDSSDVMITQEQIDQLLRKRN